MIEQIRISVIVPVYNVENYLETCVESIVMQEDRFTEILLVDDGSTDGSSRICDELARKYKCIRVTHKKNGGLSSARNAGLEEAKGTYILFVDSDDYLEPGTCRILLDHVKNHEGLDVLVFNGIEDFGYKKESMRQKANLDGTPVSGRDYLVKCYSNRNLNVEACLYMYRRVFLEENCLRFKEGILHEDVEFTPRALLAAKKVLEIQDCLYHYMIREGSISTSRNKEKNIRDLFQTLRELSGLADRQDEELRRWMKNAVVNSCLNMVYEARMYRKEYRKLLDKRFLLGKAATRYNQFRVCLCFLNVHLYCLVNDMSKWFSGKK